MKAMGPFLSAFLAILVAGRSMEPTLRDGQQIDVVPVAFESLRVGDVVVFCHEGRKIVHRIAEIRGRKLWTKGDNNARRDAFWVAESDVIGKVVLP